MVPKVKNSKDPKHVDKIECPFCRITPLSNIMGGNRYRWMYHHIQEHCKPLEALNG